MAREPELRQWLPLLRRAAAEARGWDLRRASENGHAHVDVPSDVLPAWLLRAVLVYASRVLPVWRFVPEEPAGEEPCARPGQRAIRTLVHVQRRTHRFAGRGAEWEVDNWREAHWTYEAIADAMRHVPMRPRQPRELTLRWPAEVVAVSPVLRADQLLDAASGERLCDAAVFVAPNPRLGPGGPVHLTGTVRQLRPREAGVSALPVATLRRRYRLRARAAEGAEDFVQAARKVCPYPIFDNGVMGVEEQSVKFCDHCLACGPGPQAAFDIEEAGEGLLRAVLASGESSRPRRELRVVSEAADALRREIEVLLAR